MHSEGFDILKLQKKKADGRYTLTFINQQNGWKITLDKLNPFLQISNLQAMLKAQSNNPMLAKDIVLIARSEQLNNKKYIQDYNLRKSDTIYIRLPPEYQNYGRIDLDEQFKEIFQNSSVSEEPKSQNVNSKQPQSQQDQNFENKNQQSQNETKQVYLSHSQVQSKLMYQALSDINLGFIKNIIPKRVGEGESGTSGSYFLENVNREKVGIFKPFDQQPFAPNNPHGFTGDLNSNGFRKGILSGESWYREVAPFLLDRKQGYFSVPPTSLVEVFNPLFKGQNNVNIDKPKKQIYQEELSSVSTEAESGESQSQDQQKIVQNEKLNMIKQGSFQVFIKGCQVAADYGCSIFSDQQVHKIAILDIRILNCDRNDENILVQQQKRHDKDSNDSVNSKHSNVSEYDVQLIPIDHGLCLPDKIEICDYELTWMSWPQAQKPFSKKQLELIHKIDPQKEAELLEKYLKLRPRCIRNFIIAGTLLQMGAQSGLTIYDIGLILYRVDSDQQAPIERLIKCAQEQFQELKQTKKAQEMHKFLINQNKKQNSTDNNSNLENICEDGNENEEEDSQSKRKEKNLQNQITYKYPEDPNSIPPSSSSEASPIITQSNKLLESVPSSGKIGQTEIISPSIDSNSSLLEITGQNSSLGSPIQKRNRANSNPEISQLGDDKIELGETDLKQFVSNDIDKKLKSINSAVEETDHLQPVFLHLINEHMKIEIKKRVEQQQKLEKTQSKGGSRRPRMMSEDLEN